MSDVRFYSRSSIRFAAVIVLTAHFANMSYWQYRPFPGQSAASGIYSFNLADAQRNVTSSDDPFANDEGDACRQYFSN